VTDLTLYLSRMSGDRTDRVATALVDTWGHLMALHPDAWMETHDGVSACATGIPSPGLNGVWCSGRDPDPAAVRLLLAKLRASGLPHLVQVRPDAGRAAAAVAKEDGYAVADDVPLMCLDDPALLERADEAVAHLSVRRLGADEGALHARTAAAGFEEEVDNFVRLLPPPVMAASGLRAYVGEVEGQVVTTALGVARGEYVGIFNVATPPQHRGQGFGAAITARAARDGLASGARWAWLQSTPAAHALYEALGFTTLERWRCWVRS
jgi:GNAT superfamily N-acetyltransferase